MRGGALPPALLFAAFGLALAFAPRRAFVPSLGVLALVAAAVGFFKIGPEWRNLAFLGCWTSVLIAASSVHLPGERKLRLVMLLALNCGLWGGAVIAAAGSRLDLFKSLPLALLCLPGRWLVEIRRQLVIKVVSSWLIAIALLVATLQITTPTPGYLPDHME